MQDKRNGQNFFKCLYMLVKVKNFKYTLLIKKIYKPCLSMYRKDKIKQEILEWNENTKRYQLN